MAKWLRLEEMIQWLNPTSIPFCPGVISNSLMNPMAMFQPSHCLPASSSACPFEKTPCGAGRCWRSLQRMMLWRSNSPRQVIQGALWWDPSVVDIGSCWWWKHGEDWLYRFLERYVQIYHHNYWRYGKTVMGKNTRSFKLEQLKQAAASTGAVCLDGTPAAYYLEKGRVRWTCWTLLDVEQGEIAWNCEVKPSSTGHLWFWWWMNVREIGGVAPNGCWRSIGMAYGIGITVVRLKARQTNKLFCEGVGVASRLILAGSGDGINKWPLGPCPTHGRPAEYQSPEKNCRVATFIAWAIWPRSRREL